MMDSHMRAALDRHITGNWGEDQFCSEAICPECEEGISADDIKPGVCPCGQFVYTQEMCDNIVLE